MRVLVVEDELEIAESLCLGLTEAGIHAQYFLSGPEAIAAIGSGLPYEVAILDVMLGGQIDGYELCRRLKADGVPTAVLMLTARHDVGDRLRGFDVGADDYLAKPFAFEEVLARVRALSRRRIMPALGPDIAVEDVSMDTRARRATAGGNPLVLTMREYDILELFLRNPGQVLTKEQIHDAIWSYETDLESGLVEVYVGRVRRKLRAADSVTTIENTRGVGYRLLATDTPPRT